MNERCQASAVISERCRKDRTFVDEVTVVLRCSAARRVHIKRTVQTMYDTKMFRMLGFYLGFLGMGGRRPGDPQSARTGVFSSVTEIYCVLLTKIKFGRHWFACTNVLMLKTRRFERLSRTWPP